MTPSENAQIALARLESSVSVLEDSMKALRHSGICNKDAAAFILLETLDQSVSAINRLINRDLTPGLEELSRLDQEEDK